MRSSDWRRTLIVLVLAVPGWGLDSVSSAPPRAPSLRAESEDEKDDKRGGKDADRKDEKDDEKKADSEKAEERKPGENAKADSQQAEQPEPGDDGKADRKTDNKKADDEKADNKKAEEQKSSKSDEKTDAKESAARRKAAAVVVKQLKAAAAAIGIGPAERVAPVPQEGETAASASVATTGEEAGAARKKKKRKKKAPEPPMFRMRDGTRIAGRADLEVLAIDTAYGPLEVPVGEIVQVRFGSPRDTELGERIRTLVEQLGSDEFDLREEATEELRGVGPPALDALKEATNSEDQEVKTRAEKLVTELEEELDDLEDDQKPYLVALRGEEDEVVTLKFTAIGRVDLAHFSVKTPYGVLKLARDDILSIVFRPPPFRQLTFEIGGSKAYAGNNKWVDTGLQLTQGAFLKISAAGNLNLSNYGTNCNPDGASGVPANGLDSFPVGALVARIGAKGKPFLVGSEYEGRANGTGSLELGISFKSGSTRGQYEVEVEVEIEEEE